MNRKIKFRAWDKLINKMITESNVKEIIDTIQGDFNTTYVYDSDEWYPAYEIFGIFNYFQAIKEMRIDRYNEKSELRFELMQYTGFHDRFRNEIYESDIVYVRSEDENAIIEWDEQTARFIIHFDGWIADFDNYYGKELEIMGDIYNNPELLGGE